jgi:N-acetylneuraminic acid mutarotase
LNVIDFRADSAALRITGGRFFVSARGDMQFSYEATAPISLRTWEYTNGWAQYRSADVQDIIIRASVRSLPAPTLIPPDRTCYAGPIPAYPSGMFGHASENLGDTLYVVGGSSTGAPSTAVYTYSMTSKTWSTGVPLPTAKSGGDLVRCGNSLYYIGGGNTAITAGDAAQYKYTPGIGWQTIANIPTPVTGNNAECWGDSVIFCIAGGWSTYLTTVQVYRPATNTWSTSTPIPLGRRTQAAGLWGNKIFVAAGYRGTFQKDFYVGTIGADANTITWVQGPDVPMRGTGSSRPGGHAVNGKFYFVTGETTPGPPYPQDSVYVWDIAGSSWSQIITGRGTGAASNYWGVVSSTISGNHIKIWIPGGNVTGTTTWGLYVLTDDCSTVDVEKQTTVVPTQYELSQNYPNPFNPTTTIRFSVPTSTLLSLKVYNILGQEVATLAEGLHAAGTYNVKWDASNFATGVYFYRLQSNNFAETKKLLLLK